MTALLALVDKAGNVHDVEVVADVRTGRREAMMRNETRPSPSVFWQVREVGPIASADRRAEVIQALTAALARRDRGS